MMQVDSYVLNACKMMCLLGDDPKLLYDASISLETSIWHEYRSEDICITKWYINQGKFQEVAPKLTY